MPSLRLALAALATLGLQQTADAWAAAPAGGRSSRAAVRRALTPKGETPIGVTEAAPDHQVLDLLRRRRDTGTKPGARAADDTAHVALALEGGGMRGAVTAGMASALKHQGMADCFDSVYGSSAGAVIGAYFVSEADVRESCSIYFDVLPNAGRRFLDMRQLPRALGLGLLGLPRTGFRGAWDLARSRWGAPCMRLDYLVDDAMQRLRPLDMARFAARDAVVPLHVVASGVDSGAAVALTSKGGHFDPTSGPSLAACLKASMTLPGLAGPPSLGVVPGVAEPLVDAQLCVDRASADPRAAAGSYACPLLLLLLLRRPPPLWYYCYDGRHHRSAATTTTTATTALVLLLLL